MDLLEQRRVKVTTTITRDVPQKFWSDMIAGARQTYLSAFHQVLNDPNILDVQRLDQLFQVRHAHMEKLLNDVATNNGLACSATLLVDNGRQYVYAAKGAVGLTQTYVPAIGEMPKPARYREKLAAQNRIVSEPGLDFGTEAPELLLLKEFYGLVAHNPVGKRFTVEDQALGMIQFCVPNTDCTGWIIQLAIHDIIAEYAPATPVVKSERGPVWKADREEKKA